MNCSILDEIVLGKLHSAFRTPTPLSNELEKAYSDSSDALWKTCSESQQDLFRDFELSQFGIIAETEEYFFKYGFRYGLLLGVEISRMDDFEEDPEKKKAFTLKDLFNQAFQRGKEET